MSAGHKLQGHLDDQAIPPVTALQSSASTRRSRPRRYRGQDLGPRCRPRFYRAQALLCRPAPPYVQLGHLLVPIKGDAQGLPKASFESSPRRLTQHQQKTLQGKPSLHNTRPLKRPGIRSLSHKACIPYYKHLGAR
jgi:hypothetical protein